MASLMVQTNPDWELIVCDSHSDDGSWEFLNSFAGDSRIRLYQVPRAGLYAGWNECLRRIRTPYFCFATADDTAGPEFLARMVSVLDRHSDVDVAACQFDSIDERGHTIRPRPEYPSDVYGEWLNQPHRRAGELEFIVHLIRGGAWTSITSVMFRSSLLRSVGVFEEHGTPVVDQLWAARTALHSDTLWIPDHLATWRRHNRQASLQWNRKLALKQLELTARTINECASLMPASWKADPDWHEKLMWGARHYYRMWYGLDRAGLRSFPRRFLRNLAWSVMHEPAYAARRLASRLTWQDEVYRDSRAFLMELVREWTVPWPPTACEV